MCTKLSNYQRADVQNALVSIGEWDGEMFSYSDGDLVSTLVTLLERKQNTGDDVGLPSIADDGVSVNIPEVLKTRPTTMHRPVMTICRLHDDTIRVANTSSGEHVLIRASVDPLHTRYVVEYFRYSHAPEYITDNFIVALYEAASLLNVEF